MLALEDSSQALRRYVEDVTARRNRTRPGCFVPQFDPAEAGTEARVLTLYEHPTRETQVGHGGNGSGFVSIDNDNEAAANAWHARSDAGLTKHTLPWNMVPWRLGGGSPHPNTGDFAAGAIEVENLLPLLPGLRVVVLSGVFATAAWDRHVQPNVGDDLTVIRTWHPAPTCLAPGNRRAEHTAALHRAAQIAR